MEKKRSQVLEDKQVYRSKQVLDSTFLFTCINILRISLVVWNLSRRSSQLLFVCQFGPAWQLTWFFKIVSTEQMIQSVFSWSGYWFLFKFRHSQEGVLKIRVPEFSCNCFRTLSSLFFFFLLDLQDFFYHFHRTKVQKSPTCVSLHSLHFNPWFFMLFLLCSNTVMY